MKIFKYLSILLILSLSLACSQNVSKEEKSDSKPLVVEEKKSTQQTGGEVSNTNQTPVPVEKRITVPEDVAKKFKSVIFSVDDKKANKSLETEVLIGQKAEVAGTVVGVELEYYLPDFVMGENSVMTSKGVEENNPAAKVKIYKSGQLVFDGWLFKNYPDMHPFVDEEYGVSLKASVLK